MPITKKRLLHCICYLGGIAMVILGISACDDPPTTSEPKTHVRFVMDYGNLFDSVYVSVRYYPVSKEPWGFARFLQNNDSVTFGIQPCTHFEVDFRGFFSGFPGKSVQVSPPSHTIFTPENKTYIFRVLPDTTVSMNIK